MMCRGGIMPKWKPRVPQAMIFEARLRRLINRDDLISRGILHRSLEAIAMMNLREVELTRAEERRRTLDFAVELSGVQARYEEISCLKDEEVLCRLIRNTLGIFAIKPKNMKTICRLQANINLFVANHPSLIGQCLKVPGVYCLAQATKERQKIWTRARPLAFLATGQVEVFLLDYGDTQLVDENQTMPTKRYLIEMVPFQAIECSLYGIQPVTEGYWTKETINVALLYCYSDLETNLTLQARTLSHAQTKHSGGRQCKIYLNRSYNSNVPPMSLNKLLLLLPDVKADPEEPFDE